MYIYMRTVEYTLYIQVRDNVSFYICIRYCHSNILFISYLNNQSYKNSYTNHIILLLLLLLNKIKLN